MSETKMISLDDIAPDPNQPRKSYSESSLLELAQSIKSKGVMQPIMLRKNKSGNGYLIVYGERRYRAATVAGLVRIPAEVRELTDDEARESQIIENAQREDIHPMEEAITIKTLVEAGHDAKAISSRLGKSEYYVRQRTRLTDLITAWQKVFLDGKLSIEDALQLCLLNESQQKSLFTSQAKRYTGMITISSWHIKNFKKSLTQAPFDTTDPDLNKKMGSCSGCQFNSATAQLFPDSGSFATCSNESCYKQKGDNSFILEFNKCLEDPAIVFVSYEWYSSSNDKYQQKLEKLKLPFYFRRDYTLIEPPEVQDFEEWLEYADLKGDNEANRKQYQKEELDNYQKDLKEYQAKVDGGKYKRAYCIHGEQKGRYLYIQLNQTRSAKKKISEKKGSDSVPQKLSAADINEEIKRIQDREKRMKELDMEKVHVSTLEAIGKNDKLKKSGLILQTVDRGLMIFLLLEFGSYRILDKRKLMKSLPAESKSRYQFDEKYFSQLAKVTDDDLALLIRLLLIEKFGNKNLVNGIQIEDSALRVMARYAGIDIEAIEADQKLATDKRKVNIDKRLASLRSQLKELGKKSDKKPVKKTTKK